MENEVLTTDYEILYSSLPDFTFCRGKIVVETLLIRAFVPSNNYFTQLALFLLGDVGKSLVLYSKVIFTIGAKKYNGE